jgi:hypothetical protein
MSASDSPKPAVPTRTRLRTLAPIDPGPRPLRFTPIAPHVEVAVSPPAGRPFRAVLPAAEATPERLDALARQAADLPRLAVGPGRGAVDIALRSARGAHVKAGSLALVRRGGRGAPIPVPLDPATRRFRLGDIPAGEWEARGVAAGHGRGRLAITVRERDVSRASLRLDGNPTTGSARLRFRVGGPARRVRVMARDRLTGAQVLERTVSVVDGGIALAAVPHGALHFEFVDGSDRSCYDTDVNELTAAGSHDVLITPSWRLPPPEPDPPEWLVLPEELDGVARVLPMLGVTSVEQLASARPEWLMHRMLERGTVAVHTRVFDAAIAAAKQQLGVLPTTGTARFPVRLERGRQLARRFRPAAPGPVALDVDLGPGARGQVVIEGLSRTRTFPVSQRREIALSVSAREWAAGAVLSVRVINRTARRVDGRLEARLPAAASPDAALAAPSTRDTIHHILAALATRNPGLAPTLAASALTPQNIRGWLDRARGVMHQLGVCSINDLGTLRMDPARVLERGAYIAPAAPDASIGALPHYRLESVIGGTVLHYVPNDVIHEWAVVLAGVWDIRGQAMIISQHVRELFVVVEKILYDNGTIITWELPDLPTAPTYAPSPAAGGARHESWGADGDRGSDGDPSPSSATNGGANAVVGAPTVTMYVLDTTNNLPPILLYGQQGGKGGRGQDGGPGGDGFQGRPADETFFGGCCRNPGFGGDGGPGGNGGKGGTGGNGGEGGRITVLTTPPGINAIGLDPPLILCNPGAGGLGGFGGHGGPGGQGGAAGSADCLIHCDEMPERRGSDGANGDNGPEGDRGQRGPAMPSDAIQFLSITREEWEAALNSPHLFHILPTRSVVGGQVALFGHNFNPAIDRVMFDGNPVPGSAVLSTEVATFTVPLASGTYHSVVIQGPDERLSNSVQLLVLPSLDAIAPGTRWEEGDTVTVTGGGFMAGCQLFAEDWSASSVTVFNIPAVFVTSGELTVTMPNGPLGNLRGVRRLRVRNPSGAESEQEVVVRIGRRIIVRCAAFRLVGQDSGVSTSQSKAAIAALFVEGGFNALTDAWAPAGIAFELVGPVQDVQVDDEYAECFPNDSEDSSVELAALAAVVGVVPVMAGALNFFFCSEVEGAMAFAEFGGGPLVIGEDGDTLSPYDLMKLTAHEVGHALCLAHACDLDGEDGLPECVTAHESRLMYPEMFITSSMALTTDEIETARRTATHFERGKVHPLPASSLMQPTVPPQCFTRDTAN